MSYGYNPERWYTGEVPDGSPNSTDEVPPNLSTDDTPGAMRSRWRHYAWVEEPYPEAPAVPVAYGFDERNWFTGEVPVGSVNSVRHRPDLLAISEVPGEPRSRLVFGTWVVQAFRPVPNVMTRRAFQNRFPLMGNGVSRKYDAMSMFLTNDAYASALVPDDSARTNLRLMIQAGLNRMLVSAHVDYDVSDAANFTALMTQGFVPAEFRLSLAERQAILTTPIAPGERPSAAELNLV